MTTRARRFVRDVRALGVLAEVLTPKQRPRDGWVQVGPGVFKRNPAQPAEVPPELAGIVAGVGKLNRALDHAEALGRAFDEVERRVRARNAGQR